MGKRFEQRKLGRKGVRRAGGGRDGRRRYLRWPAEVPAAAGTGTLAAYGFAIERGRGETSEAP
jgi:hypothetical protein